MSSLRDPMTVLRSLDPAPVAADPRSPAARASLERILASDPGTTRRPPRRRPTVVRLAIAAAAVTLLCGGLVVAPSLTRSDAAFATWTATPSAVAAEQAAGLAEACRDAQRQGADASYARDLETASVAVAERRGAWNLVLLSGADGFSALCITDESRPFFRTMIGMAGYDEAPAPRSVSASSLGVGVVDDNPLSMAAGSVGSEVVEVSYDSVRHGRVEASVAEGRFALWLPGDELEEAPRQGAQVEVTYRDGTTGTATLTLG